tara:strand:- start:1299 stop:2471 length:1173 start_codon:yes stop_codon:yes gene_type:complete
MGLKPIGSEKLKGQDKINRIMEIARYNESEKNEVNHISTNSFSKKAADGNVYAIIQERDGYYLKCGINESTLEYISGPNSKKRDRFRSYSSALKRMNLVFKPINEEYNEGKGDGMYDEMEEQEKFLLNVPDEGGEEEVDVDLDMELGDEEMDSDMDLDMGDEVDDEEMDVDLDMELGGEEGEEDMEGFMKSIQKLTGKLGQKLRDAEEDMGSEDIKYVLNSVISAVDLDNLDDEDRDDVLDRFEDDEAEYGDDEDMEIDLGDEEMALDGEEMDLDSEEMDLDGEELEDEDGLAMEALRKRVGSLLESYTQKDSNKRKSPEPKKYLKARIFNIQEEKKIKKNSSSIEQEISIKKFIKENNEFSVYGRNKQGNVILTSNKEKVLVTKVGNII